MIEFGSFRYDPESRFLYRGDEEILLPPRVLAVLESLLKRPGKVITKDAVLESAWAGAFVGEDSLTQAISQLRSALGDDPQRPAYIQTIPKRGYRLIADVSEALPPGGPILEPLGSPEDEVAPAASPVAREPSGEAPAPSDGTAIFPDARLGGYVVVKRIGAGAMGEVWRARDEELGRDVAIKVVPRELAGDAAVMERFRREARLLAAANHPNIATIHSVEESGGLRFIVMELLEGETLAARLERGPLATNECLEIVRQVAEALEAAHDNGIIHRDLKPGNVLVTDAGRVKLLDFGLAKELRTDGRCEEQEATSLTRSGVLLGTAPYMSPEQVRGQAVDKRADIWAFGCLLYELLTGERAFRGETMADTLAAIIELEPDWQRLPDAVSPPVRRLLHRCLSKDPRDRLHDIADARIEIAEAISGPPEGTSEAAGGAAAATAIDAATAAAPTVGSAPGGQRVVPWGATAAAIFTVAVLIGTFAVWSRSRPDDAREAISIPIRLPVSLELNDNRQILAISPDGNRLAYIGEFEGKPRQLFVHEVGELEPRAIPGTEEASFPFFSPDGESVGFRRPGSLLKVSLGGGDPVSLVTLSRLQGASWGPDGTIVYVPDYGAGIWRVFADGGEPELVIAPDEANGEMDLLWPVFLPDGDHVLYTSAAANRNQADIAVVSLATGERKTLYEQGGFYARYAPPGHLVFGQRGVLLAVPFDLERLEVTGSAVRLRETVRMAQAEGSADFVLSADGSLGYISGGRDPVADNTIVLIDRQGTIQTLDQAFGADPRFSPDGKELVTWEAREDQDIWRYDLARDAASRVTLDPAWDGYPIWSPDGTRILFASDRAGSAWRIFSKAADGSGAAELFLDTERTISPGSWSRDGRFLAFNQSGLETRGDIGVYAADNPADPEVFAATRYGEDRADFAPNGDFIAYHSDESGSQEVYVAPYPDRLPRVLVSTQGGAYPRWGPDGSELFYVAPRSTGGDLMVVRVDTEPVLRFGEPRLLFDAGPDSPQKLSTLRGYDVSPDGQQFVLNVQRLPVPQQLNLVLNWFVELERQVPTGG